MATMEHTINDAIARLLRKTRHSWRTLDVVSSENTGMLTGSNKRPDIVIVETMVSPVVIETEILPAITVETEAISRLGQHLRTDGRLILSSIAVRLPAILKNRSGISLAEELAKTKGIEMAVYTGSSSDSYKRWPSSGWLKGGIVDLSVLAQSASVPPDIIEQATIQLLEGVSETAGLLSGVAQKSPGAMMKICEDLRQHDDEQTRGMAATILINAFVFQETLARGPGALANVLSVEELKGSDSFTKQGVLSEWRKILLVNYWPIFDIARRILEAVPATYTKQLLDRLALTTTKLVENRLMHSHDLMGAVFQKLISDRKLLAAYYTTPGSAALLIGLAITPDVPFCGEEWSQPEVVEALRIGDFACGTGTLLSSAYQRMGQLHELAGGNSGERHPAWMANSMFGCDVLPAAAHLTASMLSGAHPTVTYKRSCIITVPYGKQRNGGVALGSLDLLDPQMKLDIIAITAKNAGASGETETDTSNEIPHSTFDLVVMNPPFTRSTGHEGKKIGIPRPMFAAFSSTKEEQKQMAMAMKALTKKSSVHGNAGEGSIFLVLAHRKVKEKSGTLALVMPLSLISGESWSSSRSLLSEKYGELVIVSIAGATSKEMSFSADTDMGECLIVARRTGAASSRATFIVLKERPAYPLIGAEVAKQIRELIANKPLRRLEDGPIGGTSLYFGDDVIGQAVDAPIPKSHTWNPYRIIDLSLAQTAHQITQNRRIWLPAMQESEAIELPICGLHAIAEIGPYHSDVEGDTTKGGVRGPFIISDIRKGTVPTYPVLWTHDARRETTLMFHEDSEAQPRQPLTAQEELLIAQKVKMIWATASHCHFNQNFRFNSQPTAMQFTPRRTIGGRAWISVKLPSMDLEKALVVWGNTTIGLLLHWYYSSKQQDGRGNIGRTALYDLPVLNVTAITSKQLTAATQIFDEFKKGNLLPFNELDHDLVRHEIDRRFVIDVLGMPANITERGGVLDLLRRKLAQEPSIRGGKHATTGMGIELDDF